jgi:hypothetical protein
MIRGLKPVTCVVALAFAGCGGGNSSPTGGNNTPSTTVPTTVAPAPSPTPPTGAGSTCTLGKGTADTSCYKTTNTFGQQVDEAIDLLVKQRPELFDLTDQRGPGGYLVKDFDAYYAGVVKNLQALPGTCAGFDYQYLNVKNSQEFSDQFDILASSGHARRGESTYQGSCFPANFPLDPKDVIAYIRVAFFGFKCDPGVVPPPNPLGKLPEGCVGFVTATPKDKNGEDVDARIHGQDIQWLLTEGKGVVDTHHVDGQPFNWELQPLRLGTFQWCATLQGITGCLNGEVIPNPSE